VDRIYREDVPAALMGVSRSRSTSARDYEPNPEPGYLLIPHDAIAENMTIEGLAQHYAVDFIRSLFISLAGVLNFELYRRTTPVTHCNHDHIVPYPG